MKHYVVSFFASSIDYSQLIKEQSMKQPPNAVYVSRGCKR